MTSQGLIHIILLSFLGPVVNAMLSPRCSVMAARRKWVRWNGEWRGKDFPPHLAEVHWENLAIKQDCPQIAYGNLTTPIRLATCMSGYGLITTSLQADNVWVASAGDMLPGLFDYNLDHFYHCNAQLAMKRFPQPEKNTSSLKCYVFLCYLGYSVCTEQNCGKT